MAIILNLNSETSHTYFTLSSLLEDNSAVVDEAIQTILRREAFPKPYEALKDLTRTNTKITEKYISKFISNLPVSDELKAELKVISPFNFTGI
jgi:adenylosuccinate lyase